MRKRINITAVLGFVFLCVLLLAMPVSAAAQKNNTWVKTSAGSYNYYNSEGNKVKGLQNINGNYYYFNSKGRQLTGWRKIGREYYFFKNTPGKNGSMQKNKKVNGVTLKSNGKAKQTGSVKTKLYVMVKAQKIVDKITKDSMSKTKKLRTAFNYTIKTYAYATRRKFSNFRGWDQAYALDMFDGGRGNCFSYAAAFAYLANAIGYKAYVISSGGHGWCEINNKVYDPDWTFVDKAHTYFAQSYNVSGAMVPSYKNNRAYVVGI